MKKYNVCIVGGGSTYTPGFLKSFVRLKEEFPIAKLVLVDWGIWKDLIWRKIQRTRIFVYY